MRGHLAAQAAFIEGDTRDDADLQFPAQREKLVFGSLIENVVDHLHDINQACAHGLETVLRLPTVDADAEGANPFVGFEFLDGFAKFRLVSPAIVPNVKLQDIDRIFAKFFADQFCVLENMFGGEDFAVFVFGRGGPLVVHGRNFGRGVKPVNRWVTEIIALQDFAEQAVAFPFAVGPGGIEEIAAQVNRELEGFQGFIVVRAGPSAHAPQAVGHVADLKVSAPQDAIFHSSLASKRAIPPNHQGPK